MSPSSPANKKSAPEEQPEAKTDGCVHHWVIDPPNGAVSMGRCKSCGEEQEFRNSFEYSSWYGTKSPAAKGGQNQSAGAASTGTTPAKSAEAAPKSADAAPKDK